MTRTPIDAAAAEFARHTKSGSGWALGLAVASCVRPGEGNGRPPRNRSSRNSSHKVSAREFATKAGTSAGRVLRYLTAWERAAAAGVAPATDRLTPDNWNSENHLPTGVNWSDYYDAAEDAGTRATPGNIARQMAADPALAAAAAAALPPKTIAERVREEPKVAKAIVANADAHRAVIRASAEKEPAPRDRIEVETEAPFAKLLLQLGVIRLANDAQGVRDRVLDRNSGYGWRPGEVEAVLNETTKVERAMDDVRTVLTTDVSDDALARLIEG